MCNQLHNAIDKLWETIEWLNEELEKTKSPVFTEMGVYFPNIPKWLENQIIKQIKTGLVVTAIRDYYHFTQEPLIRCRKIIYDLRDTLNNS